MAVLQAKAFTVGTRVTTAFYPKEELESRKSQKVPHSRFHFNGYWKDMLIFSQNVDFLFC